MDNCICDNCAYYNVFSGVCCNADSEQCADFVMHDETCKHWLSAEEFENIRRECNELPDKPGGTA